jgi:polyisoprenyl-phosphate glycosyltransferase
MKIVSIVVPAYNEEAVLDEFFDRVLAVADGQPAYAFRIILVDDGSSDRSLEMALSWRGKDPRVAVLSLSRNFGHEEALAAGLEAALGDAAIVMDADLQDPPELILELLAKWEEGFDVVNAHRSSRREDSFLKRWTAREFYKTINSLSGKVPIPENVGNYRLISRRVIDLLNSMPEKTRVFRVLIPYLGFRTATVDYIRPRRVAGSSHYNYSGMTRLAVDGITSATTIPLQFAVKAGIVVSLVGFLYLAFIVLSALVHNTAVTGWASTMSVILFLGGIQLLFLGVIGVYIGRIFEEVKDRPGHIVQKAWIAPLDRDESGVS